MKLRSFAAIALVAVASLPGAASAQKMLGMTESNAWEFGIAFGDVGRAITVSRTIGTRTFAAMDKRFSVGWGLRGSLLGGDNLPHLGRGGQGDSLLVANPGVLALNLMISGTARLNSNIELGANLDLTGITLGGDKRGDLHAVNAGLSGPQTVQATKFNAFGFGSGMHRGSMVSEVFLQYGVSSEWKMKFGYSKFWTDYNTPGLVVNGSRRFIASVNAAFVGARYTPQ